MIRYKHLSGPVSLALLAIAAFALLSMGITKEVPVTSLSGTVVMEGGQPLPNADVILQVGGLEEYSFFEEGQVYEVETNEKGEFQFGQVPLGDAVLYVAGKAHRVDWRPVVLREGESAELDLIAKRDSPRINLNAGASVFTPNDKVMIRAEGLLDLQGGSDYALTLYRMTEKGITEHLSIDVAVSDNFGYYASKKNPDDYLVVSKEKREADIVDIEGVFVDHIDIGSLPEGVYVLSAVTGKTRGSVAFIVSKVAMVTKMDGNSGLAYVTDIETGEPIQGAQINFAMEGKSGDVAITNGDGIAKLDAVVPGLNGKTLFTASYGKSFAQTTVWKYNSSDNDLREFVQLDRTVYKPGDTVQFKVTLRQDTEQGYKVPAPRPITFNLKDSNNATLGSITATTSAWGTADGSFRVPADAAIGNYAIEMTSGEFNRYVWIPVMSYRTPSYKVKVTPENSAYVRGDRIRYTIECRSFTGEPLVGAKVSADLYYVWDWYGSPFDEGAPTWDAWDDYNSQYAQTIDKTLITDEEGKCVVTVDTSKIHDENFRFSNLVVNLDASIEGPGGEYVSGEANAYVQRGTFGMEVDASRSIVDVGQTASAQIKISDLGQVRSDIEVLVEREIMGKTQVAYDTISQQKLPKSATEVSFKTAEAGFYVITARAKDSRGNQLEARGYVYVYGDASEPQQLPELQVIAEKQKYEPGESARCIVITDKPGGSVLVTLESDQLKFSKVIQMNSTSEEVLIPLDNEAIPNAFVVATRIYGKSYHSSSRELMLGTETRKMDVQITPDRKSVRPGDTVTLNVKTSYEGKPVPADIGLSVVDEGIYQIREDSADPLDAFYPRQYSNVQTAYSFPEIYLQGESKEGKDEEIRSDFRDTAFWAPAVRTDAKGEASVTVTLPDNLTEWRFTAIGITQSTLVAKSKTSVVAKKPVMVRLALPTYLVQGDRRQITGTVTNGSDAPFDALVHLKTKNGSKIEGATDVKIHVEPNETEVLHWFMTPAMSEGEAITLSATAQATGEQIDGQSDAVRETIPVSVKGIEIKDGWFASVDNGKSQTYEFEILKDRTRENLVLELSSSLIASLKKPIDELVDYPYGCIEQTMSRFVPALVVQQYLQLSGESDPALAMKIQDVTSQSLGRVGSMQGYSGGWGWFTHDEVDPQMTALVLEDLHRAKSLGVTVNQDMINRALEAATQTIKTEPDPALIYSVLLWNSENKIARAGLDRAIRLKELDLNELAFLSLGYNLVSSRNPAYGRFKGALASQGGSFAIPREGARYLQTVLAIEGQSPLADQLLTSLLASRDGTSWYSTWDTSAALQAIVQYLQVTGDRFSPAQVDIYLDDVLVQTVDLNSISQVESIGLPIGAITPGKHQVKLVATGGTVYASARFKQFIRRDQIEPRSDLSGVSFTREYFRMVPTRFQDGTMKLHPESKPTTKFKPGEILHVRLTVHSKGDLHHVNIVDPIPSNCRIVDADTPPLYYDWWNWWSSSSYYDDKAVLFARTIPKGEQVFEYAVRVEAPGTCVALPAELMGMYNPQIYARTSMLTLEARD